MLDSDLLEPWSRRGSGGQHSRELYKSGVFLFFEIGPKK